MGLSVRVFLADEEGDLRRIPYARFRRLWDNHPREAIPELGDRYAKFAVAYVETENRQPQAITHVDYMRVKLDGTGKIDEAHVRESERLAAQSLEWTFMNGSHRHDGPHNVIPAQHIFHLRRYKNQFSWEPSRTQESHLARLALS